MPKTLDGDFFPGNVIMEYAKKVFKMTRDNTDK